MRADDDVGQPPWFGESDRLEGHLAFAGEKKQRSLLDERPGEDDPLRGAGRRDAVGGHRTVAPEHDPVPRGGHAAEMFRRSGRDLVGEQLPCVVPLEQAAVQEQPVRGGA